ncbi:cytochrome c oxidase assembly protein [Sulfoacidibacillus thermotolerans]|uniref:Uncharacterized protein n=1 Tax=Sulfoacidibacillus thermotolerans TaxID=1765684 RepID=A0A2U3D976_SULT2|nr:cytochrome c oxidase assembly protein [Sulfoacidibacillus thermotolerans]PWI57821.1 hypothetical protein BM613_06415 [Sulfoacidibacillus thermotolerans]
MAWLENMHEQWLLWRPDVVLLVFLLALTFVLFEVRIVRQVAADPQQEKRRRWSTPARYVAFFVGIVLLYIAYGPLAFYAQTRFFTAYIAQMLIMTMALPWLLVFSLPPSAFSPWLTISWVARTLQFLVQPAFALVTFNALVSVTLLPPILPLMLTVNWVHMIAQFFIFLAAICFWWPLAAPLSKVSALTLGQKLFYITYSANFMMPIIFFLFFSTSPWFPFYHAIDALADQQLGSVVMLVTMYVVYGTIALRLYFHQDESIWYV